MTRHIPSLALLIAFCTAAPACANGWAMNADEVAELEGLPLKDMPPEQLAKYFAHPNGYVSGFAQSELVKRGEAVVPLMEKLLADSHPWMRQGALTTLGDIYGADTQADAPQQVTSGMRRALAAMTSLSDDPHPAVSRSLGNVVEKIGVETDEVHAIVLRIAQHPNPNTRSVAVKIARGMLEHPDTIVKVGMHSSAAPNNTPRLWSWAHQLIAKYKDDAVSRQGVPVVAEFLRNTANTRPVRGMFSNGPQQSAMTLIKAQWDAEVEIMPDVVPGVCRCYVRIPYNDYDGWIAAREQAVEIVRLFSRRAVPAMRATVAEEKKWLAEASDVFVKTAIERKAAEGRVNVQKSIEYLEYVADCLEAGRPITREHPHLKKEAPKLFEDKVRDPNDLDLDDLFDE